ncbi:surfeit locus protein 2 [Hemitrygon akajei]|uniref:surfeit locus protein 2 n=1 Tax=Hemitrygon akajei TaxID=2704970 RepID=UPI003BF9B17E
MEPLSDRSSSSESSDLTAFLQRHPALQPCGNNRVKCSLTGHELPYRLADLQAYTKGKKYQRLMMKEPFDYSQFEPHIVPSTKNPLQLFCKLTIRHINKIPQHVLRHVNGKRYQKALQKYEESVALGVPYVPASLSQKKNRTRESGKESRPKSKEFWEPSESAGSEGADSDDSLSDLYPEHLFSRQEAAGEEAEMNEHIPDEQDDEMEVVAPLPRKRKNTEEKHFIKKKLKKGLAGKSSNGMKF